MIIDRTGHDMFTDDADVRVNAVNQVGVMGAGLAAQFRARDRAYFADYRAKCRAGRIKVGTIDVFDQATPKIASVPTKRHWRDASRLADVIAGIEALGRWAKANAPVRIAVPALGCGLGGLRWEAVRPHIERVFAGEEDIEVLLYGPRERR